MPANNNRRTTTLNIQSDPTDHGNNQDDAAQAVHPTRSVSITIADPNNDSPKSAYDPMADPTTVSFAKGSTRPKLSSQLASTYALRTHIPTNSVSRSVASTHSASQTIRDFSSVQLYTPPRKKWTREGWLNRADSTKDEIVIDSLEGAETYLKAHSVTNMRPELLASFDWMPARSQSGRKGTVESLIEFRWAMRQLQIENVEETIKRLKAADIGGMYSQLEYKYNSFMEKEEVWLGWRYQIVSTLADAKKTLDIKDNAPRIVSNVSRIFSERSHGRSAGGQNLSLDNLFINDLGFSEEGYDKFSNSKVFGQLIYDLYLACRYHSAALITDKQSHRRKDQSSTVLNPFWIPKSKGYKFRAYKLGNAEWAHSGRPKSRKFDATQRKDYKKFLSSLPIDDSDKVKVLILAISHELTVSAGIGFLEGTGVGRRFDITAGGPSPFWKSLGRVRKDILADGWPKGSLASFVLLSDDDERLILPFETRKFVTKKGKSAIPGSIALVDNIMRFGNLKNGLDTSAYIEFGTSLKRTTDDVVDLLDGLMNLDDPELKLHAKKIYLKIIKKLQPCIDGLVHKKRRNEPELIIAALLNLSREDVGLRQLFLRLILEVRDARDHVTTDTGIEDQLEPDADDPRPRPTQVESQLSTVGTYPHAFQVSTDYIAKKFGISMAAAQAIQAKSDALDPTPTQWGPSMFSASSNPGDMHREWARITRMAESRAAKNDKVDAAREEELTTKWQKTANWMAIKAYQSMEEVRISPQSTPSTTVMKTDANSIIKGLKWGAGHGGYSVIRRIIDLAKELQETAYDLANRDDGGGVFMNSKRLTRYNGWDENALIAVIFEIFTIMFTRYVSAEFVRTDKRIYIKYNADKNAKVYDAVSDTISISSNDNEISRAQQLKERLAEDQSTDTMVLTQDMIEGKLSVMDALQSVSNSASADAVFTDIHSFVLALEKETDVINTMISQLSAIANSVNSSATKVSNFFDTSKEDTSSRGLKKYQNNDTASKIRRYLKYKTQSELGRDVLMSMTPHQLALNRVAASKLGRVEGDESYLPSELIIEAQEIAALKAFLNEPSMRGYTGGNIRVMAVGIPMEAIDVLQNPPYVLGSKRNTELPQAKGVFEIHVHKRDLEYEDIIFRPKKFIYDRSLFLLAEAFKDVHPNVTYEHGSHTHTKSKSWNFDSVVKKVELTRATARQLETKSAMDIYKDYRYTKMSDDQRIQMIQNHVSNRLLHLYYRLLTGLTMDENTFLKHTEWNQLMIDRDAAKMVQIAQIPGYGTSHWIYTGTMPASNLMIDTRIQGQHRVRVATFKDAEQWTKPSLAAISSMARSSAYAKFGAPTRYKRMVATHRHNFRRGAAQSYIRYNMRISQSLAMGGQGNIRPRVGANVRIGMHGKKAMNRRRKAGQEVWDGKRAGIPHWNKKRKRWSDYVKQDCGSKNHKAQIEFAKKMKAMYKLAGTNITKKLVDPFKGEIVCKGPPPPPPPSPAVRRIQKNAYKVWRRARVKYNKSVRKHNTKATRHNKWLKGRVSWRENWLRKRFYSRPPRINSYHLQHFRMVCASRILGPSVMLNQILAPRTFDRVIMIPVDPDDFEIDMWRTQRLLRNKGDADRQAFLDMTEEHTLKGGRVVRKVKKRRRSENYSSFNDFFVNISTINEKEGK